MLTLTPHIIKYHKIFHPKITLSAPKLIKQVHFIHYFFVTQNKIPVQSIIFYNGKLLQIWGLFQGVVQFFLNLELPPLDFKFLTSSLAVSAPWLYWPPRERGRLSNMLRLFWGVSLRGLLSDRFFPLYSFLLPPRPNWRRAEPSPENETNSYRLHLFTAILLR